jgi:hypothetical protein
VRLDCGLLAATSHRRLATNVPGARFFPFYKKPGEKADQNKGSHLALL